MAKKKTEIEKKTYCDHCEHYGDTKVCGGCTSVFNEETQEYLTPTKYKHVETEDGDEHTCGTCMFAATYYNDQPCKKCIKSYKEFGCRSGWIDGGLEIKKPSQEKIDEAFKKKHDMIHPTSVDNVNHPSHYADSTSIECIESMEIAFGTELVYHFAVGNAYKYLWRHKNKGKVEEDLNKANWYYHKAKRLANPFDIDKLDVLKFYIDDYARRAGIQLKEVHFGGEAV